MERWDPKLVGSWIEDNKIKLVFCLREGLPHSNGVGGPKVIDLRYTSIYAQTLVL